MDYIVFLKMHGIGNDFIVIDGRNNDYNYKNLALKLCQRHYSVGADGIIILENADNNSHDYKMRIFNADGSEAEMCGNGIRTLVHFIKYFKINDNKKNCFSIKTKAGKIDTEIISYNNDNSKIRVNMGKPEFSKEKIPAKVAKRKEISDYEVSIDGQKFLLNSISIGNPHTVIFVDDLKKFSINKYGEAIENHKIFPKNTNVEFVEIVDKKTLKMRVWERGVGETLACGTGACASAVISEKKGYTSKKVNVKLQGGNLNIKLVNNNIFMTGNSKVVYKGKIKI
ncbi:MAG: diaminopimelate epimerase [Bacillota bacterium]